MTKINVVFSQSLHAYGGNNVDFNKSHYINLKLFEHFDVYYNTDEPHSFSIDITKEILFYGQYINATQAFDLTDDQAKNLKKLQWIKHCGD